MVLAALFRRKEPNLVLALSLFSDWAMIAVLLLVMTGLIDAASILLGGTGTPSAAYLAVLGAKLALVAAMLSLAAVNRFKWLPRNAEGIIATATPSVNSVWVLSWCCWPAHWASCSPCFKQS